MYKVLVCIEVVIIDVKETESEQEKAISMHIGNFYTIHHLAANNIFPVNDGIIWRAISLYHDT